MLENGPKYEQHNYRYIYLNFCSSRENIDTYILIIVDNIFPHHIKFTLPLNQMILIVP